MVLPNKIGAKGETQTSIGLRSERCAKVKTSKKTNSGIDDERRRHRM